MEDYLEKITVLLDEAESLLHSDPEITKQKIGGARDYLGEVSGFGRATKEFLDAEKHYKERFFSLDGELARIDIYIDVPCNWMHIPLPPERRKGN